MYNDKTRIVYICFRSSLSDFMLNLFFLFTVPTNILNSANKKFSEKLFKIFTGLCYYCFNNYCSQSVTLL